MGLPSIKLQPVLDPECSERKMVNLLGIPVAVTIVDLENMKGKKNKCLGNTEVLQHPEMAGV